MSPSHAYYTCTLTQSLMLITVWLYQHTYTYLCMILDIHLNICWGVSDSPKLACSASKVWIKVEPSTEDQAYLSAQADRSYLLLFLKSSCKLGGLPLSS